MLLMRDVSVFAELFIVAEMVDAKTGNTYSPNEGNLPSETAVARPVKLLMKIPLYHQRFD
jgi:hypothetical protein